MKKENNSIRFFDSVSPKELMKSLKTASDCLKNGELVCIFAEGAISKIGGQTLPFQKGMEVIMRKQNVPIIPVHLDNVWGSIFSFHGGKAYFKIPRQIRLTTTKTNSQWNFSYLHLLLPMLCSLMDIRVLVILRSY